MFKHLHHVIPCALLFAAGPFSMQAHALTDDERLARIENDIMKLHLKRPQAVVAGVYPTGPNPSYLVPPAPRRPYDWTGFYAGAYGGLSGMSDTNGPSFQFPTFGTLQANDVGYAGSSLYNSVGVASQTYNSFANQIVGNGVQVPGVASTASGYVNNGGGVAPGVASTGTQGGAGIFGNGVGTAQVVNTPFNYGTANQTNSQFTNHFDAKRLAGVLGAELGYRKQVGNFVFGVAVDGGVIGGQENNSSTSQGQFSNLQGIGTTANGEGCSANNGGVCAVANNVSAASSVGVQNNGSSASSLVVRGGPQWLGTAKLTGGYAVDRVLLYATGGFAYAQSSIAASGSYSDNVTSVCNATVPQTNGPSFSTISGSGNNAIATTNYSCNGAANTGTAYTSSTVATFSGNKSRFMPGFVIGGGVAYALTDFITLNMEGNYYDVGTIRTQVVGFGTQTGAGNNANGGFVGNRAISVTPFTVSQKIDGVIGKVGIQFHFSTGVPDPVVVPVADPIYAKY